MKILHFKELESTNKHAKDLAKKGEPEGTVIIADKQTCGYGRMGRHFHSPKASGLYMSIILRPKLKPADCLLITTAAAVAVSLAIEEICDKATGIKWVNDIFIADKKVCGILTEAGFSSGGMLDYAILGIGVNIYTPKEGFALEIKDIAGSIFDSPNDADIRDTLAESIIGNFKAFYSDITNKPHLDKYKQRSIVTGRKITVIQGAKSYKATALGIGDDFRLTVKDTNDNITALDSGEISIRM